MNLIVRFMDVNATAGTQRREVTLEGSVASQYLHSADARQ